MHQNIGWWTDVVFELAGRRSSRWHDRLGRRVEYDRAALDAMAKAAMRAQTVLDEESAVSAVEQAFVKVEEPWRLEWALRKSKPRGLLV